ncbi:hypothetical protein IPC1332_09005 [Pseudomonas aeruginosa]|nr:hypothetical protein IPC1332_09005 [Pseudomonas aeruginosa]
MKSELESFSAWVSKKRLTESDVAWIQNYLHGKGEISLRGPVDLDRLLKVGVQLERTDSGRNSLRQLKAAYRTRKSRSAEERSSTGDIRPAEQNLSSQNRNYKALTNLADEVLKYEETLKAKLKHSESQIKELKERISKSKKITQKALNKSKKAAQTLNNLRESPLKNSEIEKIIQDNEEIKELLIDTLNTLDPLPPQKRTIRDSDINRYKKWTAAKTTETTETQNTPQKKKLTTIFKIIEKQTKPFTD